jgi:hypothetical protein
MPASETIDSGATGAPTTTRKPRGRRKTDGAPPSTAAKPPRRRAAPKAAVEAPPPVAAAAVTPADTGTQVIEPDTTVVELQSVGLATGASDEPGAPLAEPAIHEGSAETPDTPLAPPTAPTAGQSEATAGDPPHEAHVAAAVDQVIRESQAAPPSRAPRQEKPAGKFSDRVLAAAQTRFASDPGRAPLSREQLDDLLVLLHEPGQDRSLVASTYGYLERGMSMRHARTQIQKLRASAAERRA